MTEITTTVEAKTCTENGETYEYTVITESFVHSVYLNNWTHDVKFTRWYLEGNAPRKHWESESVFAFRIGNGVKLHRGSIRMWECDSVEAARKAGYRSDRVFTIDGRVFALQMSDTIRNRQAVAVAWADQFRDTKTATAQTYYGSL